MTGEIGTGPFRGLARATIGLFLVSTIFPVAAGFLRLPVPSRVLGIADVVVAALAIVAAIMLWYRTQGTITPRHRLTAARWTQNLLSIVPILLAGFLVWGDRLDWTVLTVGLAWRGWMFAMLLPSLAAGLIRD